ncbi:methyltransferase domain-containing protein [Candidatus Sumerlaeota bacterium]|nr:methyltransferase domain-containing protein [Candidatus Sumerlaeota bacterium]
MSAVTTEAKHKAAIPLDEVRRRGIELAAGGGADAVYEMFKRALAMVPSGGDALDYGCGKGTMAFHLAKTGKYSSVTAVDILGQPANLPAGVKWVSADLNHALATVPDASIDLIVSSEVIEHLENPRATIRDWFRILRPGGTLMFSTPNNESWRAILALVVQGHFVAFGEKCYPAHITALLRRDMERIAVESGFQKPRFGYSNSGAVPRLPHISWQKVSFGALKGVRFSDNVIAIARKPS